MSAKVVTAVFNALRKSELAHDWGLADLVIQLFAWEKLSKQSQIPREASLEHLIDEPSFFLQFISTALSHLQQLEPEQISKAFPIPDSGFVSEAAADEALTILEAASRADIIDYSEIVPTALAASATRGGSFVPRGLAELLVAIADVQSTDRIYTPFDSSFALASVAAEFSETVYAESGTIDESLAFLINILEEKKLQAKKTDPIYEPGWTVDGSLDKFDVTVAIPPLGKRIDTKKLNDWYDRFPYLSAFGEVYAIQHALAQTKRKIVIGVPEGVLFRSSQMETEFRRHLVMEGLLESVVAMPAGVLQPASQIPLSLLIIDCEQKAKDVQFVDAADALKTETENFAETRRFFKSTIQKDIVLEHLNTRGNSEKTYLASFEEIVSNDFNLVASRYVISEAQRGLTRTLEEYDLVGLADIADLIRPQSIRKQSDVDGERYIEIWPGDVPDGGYLGKSDREIILLEDQIERAARQKLRPNDIMLSVKGTIGAVGLVAPNFDEDFLPSQSLLIIRLKPDAGIDPRALYMYLRSKIFQTYLAGLSTGATIKMVPMNDIKKLPIVKMTAEEQREAIMTFDEEVHLLTKIDQLKLEHDGLKARHWGGDIALL